MAKNVLQKHWDGTKFEEIHPVTKTTNVFDANGKSIEEKLATHSADEMPHQYTDGAKKYRWGFRTKNGVPQFIREEII